MAVAKKGARNITVNEVHYRWRATGNDGWISLIVWPDALPGDKLLCSFDYDQTEVPHAVGGGATPIHQLVVTNRLVRRVVLHALSTGYRPDVKTKDGRRNLGDAEVWIDGGDAVRGK